MTKKLQVVEEKEKAFGQRVVGLRNWVDSYHTYKLWQKGILLDSLIFLLFLVSVSFSVFDFFSFFVFCFFSPSFH
jgi:hypothetical protein